MSVESERKYLDVDLQKISLLLSGMSAISSGPYFEINIIFDNPDLELVNKKKLLRLRAKIWPDKTEYILTFKLPVSNLTQAENNLVFAAQSVKLREELEVNVSDFKTCINILNNLGYSEITRYEKIRESWIIKNNPHLHVDVDYLPFCKVVEIEGQPEEIDRLARMLDLDKMKISTKSYYELYLNNFSGNDNHPNPLSMTKFNIVFNNAEKAEFMEKYNFPDIILYRNI